jgi:hypothetical protein
MCFLCRKYGERLTIVRKIKKEGGSSYEILNSENHVSQHQLAPHLFFFHPSFPSFEFQSTNFSISTSNFPPQVKSTQSREVNAIVNHFNIQVNNPCAIMTQETSKVRRRTHVKGERCDRKGESIRCFDVCRGVEVLFHFIFALPVVHYIQNGP